MNLSLKQPLQADSRAEIGAEGAVANSRLAPVVEQAPLHETQKAKVRRLAAHCQKYRGAVTGLAVLQLATTLAPLVVIIGLMFATAEHAYWATLLLAVPAAGFFVRAFIIQHDCGHGSFFRSQRLNDFVGRCMSVITLAPYGLWRREHAQHHATSGNLDRRGAGDIETMTVSEYRKLSPFAKLRYRLYRNPLFLFGFGVPAYFVVLQRLPWLHSLPAREAWRSVLGLNLALVAVYSPLIFIFGVSKVVLIALPVVHIASAVGGWLFFVQHQFEETTWEKAEGWDFQVAALLGSSYYALPRVLNWFTGNIGLHHIHHLNSTIPNYRLQSCLDASPELRAINKLTLLESLRCARLKLWDDKERRMIRFDELPAAS